MSIQSEVTRISDEVSAQTALIEQIKDALVGKIAGGGVETKTITVTNDKGYFSFYYMDADGNPQTLSASGEIDALGGFVVCILYNQSLGANYTATVDYENGTVVYLKEAHLVHIGVHCFDSGGTISADVTMTGAPEV